MKLPVFQQAIKALKENPNKTNAFLLSNYLSLRSV